MRAEPALGVLLLLASAIAGGCRAGGGGTAADTAEAPAPPPCPGVGSAVDVGGTALSVKLVSVSWYRSIGQGAQAANAREGEAFCLLELEWIPSAGGGAEALPAVRLAAGDVTFDGDDAARSAFLAMQAEGRYRVGLPLAGPAREVRVFLVPVEAAAAGLRLQVEAAGGRDRTEFCLARTVVR